MYATYKNIDQMRMVYRAMKKKLTGIGSDQGTYISMNKQNKRITCPDSMGSLLEQKSDQLASKYEIHA